MKLDSQNYSDADTSHRTDRTAQNFLLVYFGQDSMMAQSRH